ncbi:hypothetical protein MMP66_17260 [Acinetobacter dispersus]|uniref:hypothetical protein n=1 Tax=Acinetobacter dispersus TaxID=70348 RepID=UPI001F4A57D3|nr:hypothetical protein [Acinetobacter dispersus]MCH7395996.1 hypothetical protein [Acinetobacter dispersus]
MQKAVKELLVLGPFPVSELALTNDSALELVQKIQAQIEQIKEPVTNEEAKALCTLFGPDDYFGLVQSLMGILETAPSWPIRELFQNNDNIWVKLLENRARLIKT